MKKIYSEIINFSVPRTWLTITLADLVRNRKTAVLSDCRRFYVLHLISVIGGIVIVRGVVVGRIVVRIIVRITNHLATFN